MILFEALIGGAFDHLNRQHSGEFDQNFSKESNVPGFARGGGGGRMGSFGIDWYIMADSVQCLSQSDYSICSNILVEFC